MEIQQLRYFLVAARYQHVTKAAEEIHIAQPALSQIIKRLESEVGTSLFEKNGRNITLTPEGKILQEEALKILKTIDELPIVLQKKESGTGQNHQNQSVGCNHLAYACNHCV